MRPLRLTLLSRREGSRARPLDGGVVIHETVRTYVRPRCPRNRSPFDLEWPRRRPAPSSWSPRTAVVLPPYRRPTIACKLLDDCGRVPLFADPDPDAGGTPVEGSGLALRRRPLGGPMMSPEGDVAWPRASHGTAISPPAAASDRARGRGIAPYPSSAWTVRDSHRNARLHCVWASAGKYLCAHSCVDGDGLRLSRSAPRRCQPTASARVGPGLGNRRSGGGD